MTATDFLCLTPLLIIAVAPVVIMIVISVLRNYKVVYGFSVLSLMLALASVFFIVPAIPHAIEPLFIIDIYSLFFLGIIILSGHRNVKHILVHTDSIPKIKRQFN